MSRSQRKTPIFGYTKCNSERADKQSWHRRLRSQERSKLANASEEALGAHLSPVEDEIVNVWAMGKDGRQYWPTGNQAITAQRIANQRGGTATERASLKKRLLRKWMSK